MIDILYVVSLLKEYADTRDIEPQELLRVCQRGIDFVLSRLAPEADPQSPLAAKTAAAMARYYLFPRLSSLTDKLSSCRIGDVTVQRAIEREFLMETQLKNEALAQAAEILTDGRFFFEAT